jgi:hypothetical protein
MFGQMMTTWGMRRGRFARKVQVMELPPLQTGLTLSTLDVAAARS